MKIRKALKDLFLDILPGFSLFLSFASYVGFWGYVYLSFFWFLWFSLNLSLTSFAIAIVPKIMIDPFIAGLFYLGFRCFLSVYKEYRDKMPDLLK